ncbi:MAG: DUF763 domain-containing protein [Nitrososphaeria archaeon]
MNVLRKSGIADLPLHGGRCPRWLFPKMVKLSKEISETIILEFGKEEFLRRISDPFFFQSFGCAVGFDWHSSGLTTTLTGALKEAISVEEHGIAVCGGKGRMSKKTLDELDEAGQIFSFSSDRIERLKYTSKIVAKVDNTAIQSGYQLYHHVFFVDEKGKWAVVQQGMNPANGYARRYHWLSDEVKSFVVEPHSAIVGDNVEKKVLNLTSVKSTETQKTITDVSREKPHKIQNMLQELHDRSCITLLDWINPSTKKLEADHLVMPRNIDWEAVRQLYDKQPENFEEVLMTNGVGPNTLRALALISNLIYGTEIDWKDPIKYSFSVGGKDGVPFPIDRQAYSNSTKFLKEAIENARIGKDEQVKALRRLGNLV